MLACPVTNDAGPLRQRSPPPALARGTAGWLGRAAVLANRGLIRLSRSLFSYQIYVLAESTPDVSFVLRDTQSRSAARVSNGVESATNGRHWS